MNFVEINDRISYIPSSDRPLSADVYWIRGDVYNWIFDVGSNETSFEELQKIENKRIVISHFHADHGANLSRLLEEGFLRDNLFLSPYSQKRFGESTEVTEEVIFTDGIKLRILPFPSSHAKGCLAMEVEKRYLFVGDGIYPQPKKDGPSLYNVQHLKEAIDLLKNTAATELVLSHNRCFSRPKAVIIKHLENVYERRKPGSPWIVGDSSVFGA